MKDIILNPIKILNNVNFFNNFFIISFLMILLIMRHKQNPNTKISIITHIKSKVGFGFMLLTLRCYFS